MSVFDLDNEQVAAMMQKIGDVLVEHLGIYLGRHAW
jgi:hypothetical protein